MQLIDPGHKFYRPLWVRVAVVVVCASWFAVELLAGASFWVVIVGALTAYSAFVLLYQYKAVDEAAQPPVAVEPERVDEPAKPE